MKGEPYVVVDTRYTEGDAPRHVTMFGRTTIRRGVDGALRFKMTVPALDADNPIFSIELGADQRGTIIVGDDISSRRLSADVRAFESISHFGDIDRTFLTTRMHAALHIVTRREKTLEAIDQRLDGPLEAYRLLGIAVDQYGQVRLWTDPAFDAADPSIPRDLDPLNRPF